MNVRTKPVAVSVAPVEAGTERCRTNSRRGQTSQQRTSYPPVMAVCRSLDVLRAVNRLRIASVSAINGMTGIPQPTVVRMLETLMSQGYVVRDNMCGGYRVTCKVRDLTSGYEGVSKIIEVSRPLAIDLTRRIKWPIGLGLVTGDRLTIQFWTGSISPWSHTSTVLGLHPDFQSSAMGRAYLAFCTPAEVERHLGLLRADPSRGFDAEAETKFRALLTRIRADGYALRDPRTKPDRTYTLAMPIRDGEQVCALISVSYFKSAVAPDEVVSQIVAPLRATTEKIEEAFEFARGGQMAGLERGEVDVGF
jgi:IclR family mhp operon transcriptional activator